MNTPTEAIWRKYPGDILREKRQYRWRLRLDAELFVTFIAWMRERGAGYQNVFSPAFDHWDGYSVNVPQFTQWQECEQSQMKDYDVREIQIEGIQLDPCPFCKTIPIWKGMDHNQYGTSIGAYPNRFNVWWLECCAWAKSPRGSVRQIFETRAALLSATGKEKP